MNSSGINTAIYTVACLTEFQQSLPGDSLWNIKSVHKLTMYSTCVIMGIWLFIHTYVVQTLWCTVYLTILSVYMSNWTYSPTVKLLFITWPCVITKVLLKMYSYNSYICLWSMKVSKHNLVTQDSIDCLCMIQEQQHSITSEVQTR
jgi:hypothetical protein